MEKIEQVKMQILPHQQSNSKISFEQVNKMYNNVFILSPQGFYYPYNHETRDMGWGCAWRAIQTLLSTQGIFLTFQDLYNKYSKKDNLVAILQENKKYDNQVMDQLKTKAWAPEQIPLHWAQPFFASIACLSYNISNRFFFLNGQTQSYTPSLVFSQVQTIKFPQFYQYIKIGISKGSIMIDDGQIALSIIGFRLNHENQIQFLFGDPHIKDNRTYKQAGVYSKTFNLNGKAIQNQITQNQQKQSLYSVYEKLEFQDKCWMVCMIQ